MVTYKNLGGNSGIVAYKTEPNAITVEFRSGKERFYLYTANSCGQSNVKHMCSLAQNGIGLNSFIMLNVKSDFEKKW